MSATRRVASDSCTPDHSILWLCRSNSWDRQPYVSTFGYAPEGTPTAHMKPRNISFNFLVANYVRVSLCCRSLRKLQQLGLTASNAVCLRLGVVAAHGGGNGATRDGSSIVSPICLAAEDVVGVPVCRS